MYLILVPRVVNHLNGEPSDDQYSVVATSNVYEAQKATKTARSKVYLMNDLQEVTKIDITSKDHTKGK